MAIVFATKKFHHLIYGRTDIEVQTDHLPLLSIIKKPLGQVPMRLQKMLLKLQPYTFTLVSKSGKDIPVADALSRLPIKDTEFTEIGEDLQSFNVCAFEITSINAFSDPKLEQLKQATKDDHELQMLSTQILEGWPDDRNSVPSLLKTYYDFSKQIQCHL